jgi:alkylhydroperoxidase family enzyme
MAWIQTIDERQAEGPLKEIYEQFGGPGGVSNIIKVASLHPEALANYVALYKTTMFGPSGLTRIEREAVATVVSKVNGCHY